MSKKRDLKIYMVMVLDRKSAEKDTVAESMKTTKVAFDFLVPLVMEHFEKAIKNLKKTGKLRWPPKKYGP